MNKKIEARADSYVNQGCGSQNINSNNNNNHEVLSVDEQVLVSYFRKLDEMTKIQALLCVLEKYLQMSGMKNTETEKKNEKSS